MVLLQLFHLQHNYIKAISWKEGEEEVEGDDCGEGELEVNCREGELEVIGYREGEVDVIGSGEE